MQTLLEHAHYLTLNVVFCDQLHIGIIDLVTLIEIHSHFIQGAHWVNWHVFLLVWLDYVADLCFVKQDYFANVAA